MATKCDIEEPELMGRRPIADAEYFETSAMMDIGIDELSDQLVESLQKKLPTIKPKKNRKNLREKIAHQFRKFSRKSKSFDSDISSEKYQPEEGHCATLSLPITRAVSYTHQDFKQLEEINMDHQINAECVEGPLSSCNIVLQLSQPQRVIDRKQCFNLPLNMKIEQTFERLGRQNPVIPQPTFLIDNPSFLENFTANLRETLETGINSVLALANSRSIIKQRVSENYLS